MADKNDVPPPPPPSQIPHSYPETVPFPDSSPSMITEGVTRGLAMDSDPFAGTERK